MVDTLKSSIIFFAGICTGTIGTLIIHNYINNNKSKTFKMYHYTDGGYTYYVVPKNHTWSSNSTEVFLVSETEYMVKYKVPDTQTMNFVFSN